MRNSIPPEQVYDLEDSSAAHLVIHQKCNQCNQDAIKKAVYLEARLCSHSLTRVCWKGDLNRLTNYGFFLRKMLFVFTDFNQRKLVRLCWHEPCHVLACDLVLFFRL
jgi:hypothetical protein